MNQILVYCVLDESLKLLRRQQLSIMQQFEASAFYTTVRWHEQGEVNSECTLHIPIVLAICTPKFIKLGEDLTKFWQKQVGSFFGKPLIFAKNYLNLLFFLRVTINDVRDFFFRFSVYFKVYFAWVAFPR